MVSGHREDPAPNNPIEAEVAEDGDARRAHIGAPFGSRAPASGRAAGRSRPQLLFPEIHLGIVILARDGLRHGLAAAHGLRYVVEGVGR